MELFKRAWRVQVGGFESTDVDIAFKLERTLAARPGHLELTIYNLTEDHRHEILKAPRRQHFGSALGERRPGTLVELSAGYEGERPVIFRGDLRRARQTREAPEWMVTIEAGDGGFAMRNARVSTAFSADTALADVIEAIAESMGVGAGNARDVASDATLGRVGALFPEGHVAHGQASDALTALCRSAGLEWSIQSGVLQVLRRGRALQRSAIVVSENTGMVGSPERTSRRKAKVKTLLIPGLQPGSIVELASHVINGTFRVGHMNITGDTRGGDWYAELDLTDLAYYESLRLFR